MIVSRIILIFGLFFTLLYQCAFSMLKSYDDFLLHSDEEKKPLIKKTVYKKLTVHNDLIMDIKFLKNGNFITASYDGDVKIWSKSGDLLVDLESENGTCCFDIVNKARLAIAKNYDNSSALHLLDLDETCYVQTLKPKKNTISFVLAFSPKHIFFVTNSMRPSSNSWSHIVGVDKKSIYSCKGMHVKAKKINSNRMLIIENPIDKEKKSILRVMDLETKKIKEDALSVSRVLDVALVDDTSAWLSCGDSILRLYNFEKNVIKKTVRLKVQSYTIATSKQFLAVCCGADVTVYDVGMSKKYCKFSVDKKYNYVPIIAFSPDGRLVIAASRLNDACNKTTNNDIFIKKIMETNTSLTYFLF